MSFLTPQVFTGTPDTILKSGIQYPGGKFNARKVIAQYMPKDIDCLVSPFLGGGPFELYIKQHLGIPIYGYDIYADLINYWNWRISFPSQIIEGAIKYYPIDTREKFNSVKKELKAETSPLKRAILWFVIQRTSYMGLHGSYRGDLKRTPDDPKLRDLFRLSALKTMQNLLPIPNFHVACQDFRKTLQEHPTEFMYIDPPYYAKGKTFYGGVDSKQKPFPHKELAMLLNERKGGVPAIL